MLYFIFAIYVKLIIADENVRLIPVEQNISFKIIEQAVLITSKYYQKQVRTSVVWDQNEYKGVDDFLMKYPGSVVTVPLQDDIDDTTTTKLYDVEYMQTVFFARKPESFKKFLNLLKRHQRFSIRLILVLEEPIAQHSELASYIKIAWNNNLADIVIISSNNKDEITLFTYFPYRDGKCGNYIPVTLNHDDNVFPKKFNNFNKCPLRITAIDFIPFVRIYKANGTVTGVGGYHGMAVTLLKDTINATLEFVVSTGGYEELLYDKADMVIPTGILNLERYLTTFTSHVYHKMDIRWIGPKRREIYDWIKLIEPFIECSGTPFVCLAFILFLIVVVLTRRYKLDKHDQNKSISMQIFTLLVGQTVDFVTKVPRLNNLFLIWIWFAFIIRMDYQADLVQSLQENELEPAFESLEEAVKGVGTYGGTEQMLDFYKGTPFENDFKMILSSEVHVYLSDIAKGKKFLLVTDTLLAKRVRYSIQILSFQVSTSWSCFHLRPGWPAAWTIDLKLLRLRESGFMSKNLRLNDMEYKTDTDDDEDPSHPLDLEMVSACFCGMAFMWGTCVCICLVEIVHHKYTENKKRKIRLFLS